MINPNIQVVMLGITDETSLLEHPKSGASWEGFAIEQVLQALRPLQAYFWGTYSGSELDLMFFKRANAMVLKSNSMRLQMLPLP